MLVQTAPGRELWSSGYGGETYVQEVVGWIPAPDSECTFFTLNCCKNCNVCLKRPKLNEKEARNALFKKQHFKLKFSTTCLCHIETLKNGYLKKLDKNFLLSKFRLLHSPYGIFFEFSVDTFPFKVTFFRFYLKLFWFSVQRVSLGKTRYCS